MTHSLSSRGQSRDLHLFTPSELTHLVARAGFQLDALYGGFERQPLDDAAPEIVVVASAPVR